MKSLRLVGGLLLLLGITGMGTFASSPPVLQPIWLMEIRGTIDPASTDFLETSIERAEREQAQALIVELDTPGGLVTSVRKMAQAIDQSQVPVVVYVTPAGASATSAGAILSLAAHSNAMAPGTNIGAAHPVSGDGKEVKGAMGDKILNDTTAFVRGLAELRGRDVKLAEAIVAKSKSFTAEEALKLKLIDRVAESREALIRSLNEKEIRLGGKSDPKAKSVRLRTLGAPVIQVEMSWGQKLLHYLANPNIATLLMTLGMLLIYVEVSNPGTTIAGVLGLISLLTAFMAYQLLPIRTGGVALLLLGVLLMVAEAFVAASGALAAGGVLAFILGMLWVVDPAQSDLVVSAFVWVPSAAALGLGVFAISYAAARTKKLARETLAAIGGGSEAGLAGYEGHVVSLEADGLSGTLQVRGEIWKFESKAKLSQNDAVRVDRVEGLTAHVVPAKEQSK